jgi:hypothetical protein
VDRDRYFIARLSRGRSRSPLFGSVRLEAVTSTYGSPLFAVVRKIRFRDAEVAGSNPAFPTAKVLVRGCFRPGTKNSYRAFIARKPLLRHALRSRVEFHPRPKVLVTASL